MEPEARLADNLVGVLTLALQAVVAAVALAGVEGPSLVEIPTSDGGVVFADDYGAGESAVVLAPGGRHTKDSWREQAEALAGRGLRVLAIDFRGRGRSRGGPGGMEDRLDLDVVAAVRYLRAQGATTVSVVGASLGGHAAALATAAVEPGEIDAVVLLAAASVDEPERMRGRKLFITTRDDIRGEGIRRLPEIRDQYERAPEPKKLVVLEGSAHAQAVFETDQGERLMQEIVEFLLENAN